MVKHYAFDRAGYFGGGGVRAWVTLDIKEVVLGGSGACRSTRLLWLLLVILCNSICHVRVVFI